MTEAISAPYELYYWPFLQGRGEFIRLAFEEAGAAYVDVARLPADQGGGVQAIQRMLRGGDGVLRPFAPPILKVGDLVLAQVASILHFLGPRLGLVPEDEAGRIAVNQLQLTLADLVAEVHDTHHPIGSSLYYEDQKPEAKRRAESFLSQRMPRFLGYFEEVLQQNGGQHLVGAALTYVDLSMFQVLSGLAYAFPNGLAGVAPSIPGLTALRDRVAARPRIAAYLASDRRLPFNENGIFRRYPELDAPAPAAT
jgi:glutathione S-transferase